MVAPKPYPYGELKPVSFVWNYGWKKHDRNLMNLWSQNIQHEIKTDKHTMQKKCV